MRLRSAETLQALMHQANLSTRALAEAAQCHNSFVDHLLHGRRDGCESELAQRFAAAVHVPIEVLWAEDGEVIVG